MDFSDDELAITSDPETKGKAPAHRTRPTAGSKQIKPDQLNPTPTTAPDPPVSHHTRSQRRSTAIASDQHAPLPTNASDPPRSSGSRYKAKPTAPASSSQTKQPPPAPDRRRSLESRLTDTPIASASRSKASARPPPLHERLTSEPIGEDNEQQADDVAALSQALLDIVERYKADPGQSNVQDVYRQIRDTCDDISISMDYISMVQDELSRRTAAAKAARQARSAAAPAPVQQAEQMSAADAAKAANDAVWSNARSELLAAEQELYNETQGITLESKVAAASSQALDQVVSKVTSSSSISYIPAAVLEAAPYLASLTAPIEGPPHVQQTHKLRNLFAHDSNADAVLVGLSSYASTDPLPLSLLRLIVKDRYVDFEKVHAAIQGPSHTQYEEPKDFGAGYAVVRKEHILRSVPVVTESQWLRCFEAWLTPLLVVYPHRSQELAAYKSTIMEYFHSTPDHPGTAIRIDKNARLKCDGSPCDLGDPYFLRPFLLKEMLVQNTRKRSAPSSSSSSSRPPKKVYICHNWNFDNCSEPCPNGRKHGKCHICGDAHRALHNPECKVQLSSRSRI